MNKKIENSAQNRLEIGWKVENDRRKTRETVICPIERNYALFPSPAIKKCTTIRRALGFLTTRV